MITLSLGAPQSRGLLNLPLVEFVCLPMHRALPNHKREGMEAEGVTPKDAISHRKKRKKQSKVIYGVKRNINNFLKTKAKRSRGQRVNRKAIYDHHQEKPP